MAAVTITSTAVLKTASTQTADGVAGVAIAAGEWLYLDSATNTLKLAEAGDTEAKAAVVGQALNNAAAGQPVRYASGGLVDVDNVALAGVYVLSATAGKMCPVADLVTDDWLTLLAVGRSTTQVRLAISAEGVQVA